MSYLHSSVFNFLIEQYLIIQLNNTRLFLYVVGCVGCTSNSGNTFAFVFDLPIGKYQKYQIVETKTKNRRIDHDILH